MRFGFQPGKRHAEVEALALEKERLLGEEAMAEAEEYKAQVTAELKAVAARLEDREHELARLLRERADSLGTLQVATAHPSAPLPTSQHLWPPLPTSHIATQRSPPENC